MKLGMNLLLWTADVTEAHYPLLAQLQQLGFDGVEIPLFQPDESRLPSLARELDSLGLGRTAVTVSPAQASPICPEASVRREALDYLRRRLDWCAVLGAEVLCGPFHSGLGALTGRGRTPEEWAWCLEVHRAAAEHAGAVGVRLSVEPLNRFEVYFLNTMADAARLVAEVGHPSYGYLYDSFHANIEEKDVRASVLDNAAGINHVHISENDRGTPGSGHVHWEATFGALRECGYDGWYTIEAFGRALPELAAATCIWRDLFASEMDVAREGLAFMRRMTAGAEGLR
jgi:D-psicose/D-tagatose/L-ribulose 3-epimerase